MIHCVKASCRFCPITSNLWGSGFSGSGSPFIFNAMSSKRILHVILLLFLLVGCSTTGRPPAPETPAPALASPTPSGPSSVTPVPGPFPTPEQTASLDVSKFANVYVYTFEEQANEGRSLLHMAYPVTEHPAINARLKALAEEFVEEYTTVSAEQEEAYQNYLLENGEAASFITHYVQHFDVTVADANMISLAIERYRSLGGTGSQSVVGYIFDRTTGAELSPADLFESDAYLERLSQLSRELLEREARAEAAGITFDSQAARDEWLAMRLSMIESGTRPLAENFDGILFYDDGTVRIQFDKYQVSAGAYGVVEISLPVASIVDLLTPRMQHFLRVAAPGPDAEPTTEAPPPVPPSPVVQPPGEVDCEQALCVALTFDDGPSVYTDGLLDVLLAHHARATFFVLGKSARVQQQTIARMAREGHEIGNHSWSHSNMTQITTTQVIEQIDLTNALVVEIAGVAPKYFRPPYGAYNDQVAATIPMPVILWSLDPLDWKDRDADIVAARMREAASGAIILAHDIHASTVAAMPSVLESLARRGIHFVTISELMSPAQLVPGHVYTQRIAQP